MGYIFKCIHEDVCACVLVLYVNNYVDVCACIYNIHPQEEASGGHEVFYFTTLCLADLRQGLSCSSGWPETHDIAADNPAT